MSPEEGAADAKKSVAPRPAPIALESLTAEQRGAALAAVEAKKSVFISGAAGTGKSHASKYIVQRLRARCAPTAPTGVAALNIGGSTLHSFFGLGIGTGNGPQHMIRKARKNKAAMKRINETEVLLIDEVSMMSSDLLEAIDAVAKDVRRDDRPMGGMQVVAVGDFFQLPPIINKEAMEWGRDVDEQRPFCFDSPVWSELELGEVVAAAACRDCVCFSPQ